MKKNKKEIKMKKDEELFDLLYAFPKYRRLRNRLKEVNRDNRNKDKIIRKEWEEKAVLREQLKQKNRIIFRLRKELKKVKNGKEK